MLTGIVGSLSQGYTAPPIPMTTLKMWYDASDTATLTNSSGKCSAIQNKGTTAFTLTQGTSSSQPEIITNGKNGLTCLRYDDDQLTKNNAASPIHGATALTIFVAGKAVSGTSGWKTAFGSNQANDGAMPLTIFFSDGKNYFETGSGGNPLTSGSGYAGTANIQMVKIGGSSRSQSTYVGGTSSDNQSGGNSPAVNLSGTNYLNAVGLSGGSWDFYETLWYNSVLDATDTASVVSYLTAKWAI